MNSLRGCLGLTLVPLAFLGGCMGSLRPAWKWIERGHIQVVGERDERQFPVLAQTDDGEYVAIRVYELADAPVTLVASLDDLPLAKVNQDLRNSIDAGGDHEYFRVERQPSGRLLASLEEPTTHDAKLQGWYEIDKGAVRPQRVLHYGPGLAFEVMPWILAAGIAAAAAATFVIAKLTSRGGQASGVP
ncbi:MAG: hypothetical protein CMJ58_13075 [Planctomycetaceae bacterium]|nr:hypothetical protein [Planctomycetaceae bacterium]